MQQAMQALLTEHCDLVGTLGHAEHLSRVVRTLQPDVLVLDVSLPGRSGLQVLPELRDEFPLLGIVIATNHTQAAYRTTAARLGADAFIPKDEILRELWPAVEAAFWSRRSESDLNHFRRRGS